MIVSVLFHRENGDVKIWDVRTLETLQGFTVNSGIRCMDAHPYLPLIAWWVFFINMKLSLSLMSSGRLLACCVAARVSWLCPYNIRFLSAYRCRRIANLCQSGLLTITRDLSQKARLGRAVLIRLSLKTPKFVMMLAYGRFKIFCGSDSKVWRPTIGEILLVQGLSSLLEISTMIGRVLVKMSECARILDTVPNRPWRRFWSSPNCVTAPLPARRCTSTATTPRNWPTSSITRDSWARESARSRPWGFTRDW